MPRAGPRDMPETTLDQPFGSLVFREFISEFLEMIPTEFILELPTSLLGFKV